MKKKLLFVIPSLHLGGAEKSLVNLLSSIDESKYEVDLFLFSKKGPFLDLVPNFVTVLDEYEPNVTFSRPFFTSLFTYFKKLQFRFIFHKIAFTLKNKTQKNKAIVEQNTWKNTKVFFPKFDKKYDVAIGYLEKSTIYFIIDNVKATSKLGWIHTDLEALKLNIQFEENYLKKLNHIITVSDGLKERLAALFPNLSQNIQTIENINSSVVIEKMAASEDDFAFDSNFCNIIFVGRLVKEKGLLNAVQAIKILIEKGHAVKFYLIGTGGLFADLKEFAIKNNIEDSIHFLGIKMNPYTYIKKADIFILTSFYEGKSIALEEAKILYKPIVVTNFKSAKDQVDEDSTGLISEMNPESIAAKIESLILDKSLKEKLIYNLKKSELGNQNEIIKFYKLID